MSPALRKMSLKQLLDTQVQLTVLIETKRQEEKEKLANFIREQAHRIGVKVEDIVRGKGRSSRSKLPIAYLNPNNRLQAWTGQGRRPKWLEAKLAKGAKIEDFKV